MSTIFTTSQFDRFTVGAMFALLISCQGVTMAQSQRELHYQFRDGNRWEGIKLREWKQVSGTLELASLVCYEAGWRQNKMAGIPDSVSIFVYVTQPHGITISIFDLEKLYFMDPYPPIFGKSGKNKFTWPSTILNVLNLPTNQLDAIAKARIENRQTYFPIYFLPPDRISGSLIAEISFIASKAAVLDFALYAGLSEQPIRTWNDIRVEAAELKSLKWQVEVNLSKPTDFTLVAMEKPLPENATEPRRKHVFNIYLFK